MAQTIREALVEVEHELEQAMRTYGPIASPHEAHSVIGEEFEEFWEEVKERNQDTEAMRRELIQTAAMCVRAIIDLKL